MAYEMSPASLNEKVHQLERLVRNLKAENEELVSSTLSDRSQPKAQQLLRTPLAIKTNNHSVFRTPVSAFKPPPRTPLSSTLASRKRPPGTVIRLKSQCKELDFQLADLEDENNALQDDNKALKRSLRQREEQVLDLEAANSDLTREFKKIQGEHASLSEKHDKVLEGVIARRWGTVDGCDCQVRHGQELAKLQLQIQQMSDNESRLTKLIDDLQSELIEYENRWRLEKEKRLQAERLRQVAESDILFLKTDLTGLKEQYDLAQSRHKSIVSELWSLRNKIKSEQDIRSHCKISKFESTRESDLESFQSIHHSREETINLNPKTPKECQTTPIESKTLEVTPKKELEVEPQDNFSTKSFCVDTHCGQTYRALYDFSATIEGQLSIKRGQKLIILNAIDSGWWRAKLINSSKEGYVPTNYIVQDYEEVLKGITPTKKAKDVISEV